MKVAVTGATGVIGRAVLPSLVSAGHDVAGLARTPAKARRLEELGARAVLGHLGQEPVLDSLFDGADAVLNFATEVPVGLAALRRTAWRANDRLRTDGVRRVVDAAVRAGVRRVVQESVSFLYADGGGEWVTEESPVAITRATEPASVGESHVQEYTCGSRTGVVLRLGSIIGDDPMTRFQLRSVRHGFAIGVGAPDGWAHVVHADDLGPAFLAALHAPSGVYNVGAEPVRRHELVAGFGAAAGRESIDFMAPMLQRLGGVRLEPLTRSLRVSSDHLSATTGWSPQRAKFDSTWFEVLPRRTAVS